MESIHILRDQPEYIAHATFKFYKGDVGGIRLFRSDQFSPPVVPFPNQLRVSLKGFWSCEFFCAKVAP